MSDLKDIPAPEGYEWGRHGPWEMPEWMEQFRDCIGDTGGNPVEWIISLGGKDTKGNIILAAIASCVYSQLSLLTTLHNRGLLKEAGEGD